MTEAQSIEIRNLYKIFGGNPAAHVGAVRAGMSKADLGSKHGHILGLRDILSLIHISEPTRPY